MSPDCVFLSSFQLCEVFLAEVPSTASLTKVVVPSADELFVMVAVTVDLTTSVLAITITWVRRGLLGKDFVGLAFVGLNFVRRQNDSSHGRLHLLLHALRLLEVSWGHGHWSLELHHLLLWHSWLGHLLLHHARKRHWLRHHAWVGLLVLHHTWNRHHLRLTHTGLTHARLAHTRLTHSSLVHDRLSLHMHWMLYRLHNCHSFSGCHSTLLFLCHFNLITMLYRC